jgi:hypothetical protein
VLGVAAFLGLLLVLASTWALSSLLTPGEGVRSQRQGRLGGGALVAFPLLVGVLNLCVGQAERRPLFVPLVLLNAAGVSAGFWSLHYCLLDLFTRNRQARFKALWVVLLLLGNLLVIPVYCYAFVWPARRQAAHAGSPKSVPAS